MGAARVMEYNNTEIPRQIGELGRVRVLQGSNEGAVFILKDPFAIIGRGEDCDINIPDIKASRRHVRIDALKGAWKLTDLGSANGILYLGEYVRECMIESGHHFTIGETILEFQSSNESTRVLNAPMRTPAEVVHLDHAMSQQRVRVKLAAQPVKIAASKKKTNPLLIVGVIAAGAYMYQDELIPLLADLGLIQIPKKVKAAPKEPKEDLSLLPQLLPPGSSPEVGKTAEQYYRQGFRELREENYLRARSQFALALQVNPNHALARKGLSNANNRIESEIVRLKKGAQKATVAGRFREAKGYYEAAMRMMLSDKTHPHYLECEVELKKIEEELNRGSL